MPIYRFLEDSEFGPEEIKIVVAAYERACEERGLADEAEQMKQLVANRVMAIVQTGERDPQWTGDRVVRDFQGGPQKSK